MAKEIKGAFIPLAVGGSYGFLGMGVANATTRDGTGANTRSAWLSGNLTSVGCWGGVVVCCGAEPWHPVEAAVERAKAWPTGTAHH